MDIQNNDSGILFFAEHGAAIGFVVYVYFSIFCNLFFILFDWFCNDILVMFFLIMLDNVLPKIPILIFK